MPTPERIKAAAREARKRVCVICGATFSVAKSSHAGKSCSPLCLSRLRALNQTGVIQSAESHARRSKSLKAVRADPQRNAEWAAAATAGIRKAFEDPDYANRFAARSSEVMKRRHADPEWQKVRDERSARVMRENWAKHRELYVKQAVERYARWEADGYSLNSPEAKARKARAAKWILQQAQAAMHAETDYDATFAEVQARLRRETPYDGPQEGSDYMEYLRKLGAAVAMSPECRDIADGFLTQAIPRFAAEWNKRKAQGMVAMPETGTGSAAKQDQPGPATRDAP